jgi:hypothetical protein
MNRFSTLFLAGCALAGAANARIVPISGTVFNTTPAPGIGAAPCVAGQALISINPGNSTQVTTSNFGSFGLTLAHCVPFPPIPPFAYAGPAVSYAFSGGTLFGTYTGNIGPTANPLIVTHVTNAIITGGTGKFAGATGWLTAEGTLDRTSGVNLNNQVFSGLIDAPNIPEPATWAMLIAGFGIVGAAARRRGRAFAS